MYVSVYLRDVSPGLRTIPLFSEAPQAFYESLADAVVPAEYGGGVLYRQGEPGGYVYIARMMICEY